MTTEAQRHGGFFLARRAANTVLALCLCVSVVGFSSKGRAVEATAGTVWATVVRVIDGDTIVVDAHVWPRITVRAHIRLDRIDAPELRGKCPTEKAAAAAARELVVAAVGRRVMISGMQEGKYAGRVIAEVFTQDGRRVADVLLEAGLARAYDGGKRKGWCGSDVR